ncbi:MAG: hypothetical protein U0Q18_22890 [Bryobacteraceae bacterium]
MPTDVPTLRYARDFQSGVQVYGWDARSRIWSGPTELNNPTGLSQRILKSLREAPCGSWYGPLKCGLSGQPSARLFALAHDLSDSGLGMIYCDETRTGPAGIISVIPSCLRPRLRPDFAFEFVGFARFIGALSEDSALTVHDLIQAAIAETEPPDGLAFSLSTETWASDLDHVLSECVEQMALGMMQWISERHAGVHPMRPVDDVIARQ